MLRYRSASTEPTHKVMNKKQVLTRGEEEIMQILWQLQQATVNQIIACTSEPQPKYTTVATFLKILENKGFVGHVCEGKSHRYYPILAKEEYAQTVVTSMLSNYFDGSLSQMISFFSQRENLSVQELDELLELLQKSKKTE